MKFLIKGDICASLKNVTNCALLCSITLHAWILSLVNVGRKTFRSFCHFVIYSFIYFLFLSFIYFKIFFVIYLFIVFFVIFFTFLFSFTRPATSTSTLNKLILRISLKGYKIYIYTQDRKSVV